MNWFKGDDIYQGPDPVKLRDQMLEEIRILRDETRSAADKGDALNRLEALIRQ